MIDWKPIETAPLDGTIVLVTDGKIFGFANFVRHFESEFTVDFEERNADYNRGIKRKFNYVPNPKGGQLQCEFWSSIAGWSAWREEEEWEDGEYSERMPRSIIPTHWAEGFQPPDQATSIISTSAKTGRSSPTGNIVK